MGPFGNSKCEKKRQNINKHAVQKSKITNQI